MIKEAFELCGIEVGKPMIEAMITVCILDSKDINHLNFSKFLSIGEWFIFINRSVKF